MPNVPNAPGVPALTSFGGSIPLLVADAVSVALAFLGGGGTWGIFFDGIPAIEVNSYLSFEYKQDWTIADYPVEDGGFQSYDKVQLPFDARLRVASGSSIAERSLMLAQLDFLANSIALFDVVTPEKILFDLNVAHVDYKRTSQAGLGMIVADIWFTEIRVTATAQFANTQQPSEAGQQGLGNVQPQPVPSDGAKFNAITIKTNSGEADVQDVPLQPLPNQTLQVQLANQPCTIDVYQLAYGLFFDLYVNNELIVAGVVCQNVNRLVRYEYLGFVGDFVFYDEQGDEDPVYTGLGTRFTLTYLEAADLPAGQG